jgi:hypothetical protein
VRKARGTCVRQPSRSVARPLRGWRNISITLKTPLTQVCFSGAKVCPQLGQRRCSKSTRTCLSGVMLALQHGQVTFSAARIFSRSSLRRGGMRKHYRRTKGASLCNACSHHLSTGGHRIPGQRANLGQHLCGDRGARCLLDCLPFPCSCFWFFLPHCAIPKFKQQLAPTGSSLTYR